MRVGALCAGYGGLELAVKDVWPCAETVWVAELDPHASTVLKRRFGVPNLGDLTKITDPPAVDVVTAGFPCQPFSTAGLRQGVNDERWLIDDVCRVASAAGAHTLILENVVGLLTANNGDAMARVCAAMAETGYSRWQWTTLRASDIGACHRRERWFCVAQNPDIQPRHQRRVAAPGQTQSGRARPDPGRRSGTPAADTNGVAAGRHTGTDARTQTEHARRATQHDHRPSDGARAAAHAAGPHARRRHPEALPGSPRPTADTDGQGLEGRAAHTERRNQRPTWPSRVDARFGPYQAAVDRWAHTLGRPAPDPLTDRRLNPAFVEWMMGLPDGWVTDIIDSRAKALHILGNGVVPQQAAAALRELTA